LEDRDKERIVRRNQKKLKNANLFQIITLASFWYGLIFLDIDNIIARPSQEAIIEELPWLMKGRVIPFVGIIPSTEAMWIQACKKMTIPMPKIELPSTETGFMEEKSRQDKKKNKKEEAISKQPMKPNSSPITAKIKSE
jgi:hypothetical protein